jgi:hypothetical protein
VIFNNQTHGLMFFQPKLRHFNCPLDWLFNYHVKVIRSFEDGFVYHLWISSVHMKLRWNLTGNAVILRPTSINVSKSVCLNVKRRLVVRFCDNTVFRVRLATFSFYALHILGTPEPTSERISQ